MRKIILHQTHATQEDCVQFSLLRIADQVAELIEPRADRISYVTESMISPQLENERGKTFGLSLEVII